ncbi:MAG TPA: hypothetical protein VMQ40_02680 [Acidimicrobiales bacterium]|nr:hypothetical protein [Acidimicrobiales bacterium]
MRRHAVLVGGPALLAAVAGIVLSAGVFAPQQSPRAVSLPVSAQMERALIISAHTWLGKEGVKVGVADISIVRPTDRSLGGPLAAFVAETHRFYGTACLTLHAPYRIPMARPGVMWPSPLARWPLCVLFSTSSPHKSWTVQSTAGSNCGPIGIVLRGVWGQRIPVCKVEPIVYQL